MTPETGTNRAAEARRKHEKYLQGAVANYYAESLVLDHGTGHYVTDVDGRQYLDFFGGILTVSIGHCDERVGAAIKAQVDRLGHVSSLYPVESVVDLAEKLAEITPGRLQKSIFNASGTEADETAVVLSQLFTQASEIIALRHGYSGRSTLAQALTGHAPWRAVPSQVASVKHVPAPYCYRCPYGSKDHSTCDYQCAEEIEDVIRTTTTGQIAGFIAEPILGVGGFITPPAGYFQRAVEIIRRYGGVFICDEVQTGFGRTGKMFGIEHYGVEPEIMTLAKGIANGMPIAACIATPEIADAFQKLTISTFGGNPVSAAAANETIRIMEEERLADNAAKQGARLKAGLEELQKRFPRTIGDVRGKGLMLGVELVVDETAGDRTPNPDAVARIFEETKKRGLLIGKGGLYGTSLRIAPSLTITETGIDDALKILGDSFAAIDA